MVIGILVFRSITVTEEDTKTISISAAAIVPVRELANIPTSSLNIEIARQKEYTKEKKTKRKIKALSVFGVVYTNVKLELIGPLATKGKGKLSFFRRLRYKKNPDVEYKVVINTQPGAKNFYKSGSSNRVSQIDSSEEGAKPETSTHVND